MNDMSRRVAAAAHRPPDEPPPRPPAAVRAVRRARYRHHQDRLPDRPHRIATARLRVLGFGWQKGRGVRGGGITDLEEAERAIRAAVGQAEDMADTRLRAVTVNLSCGQPESRLFNVQWPVGGRAVDRARYPPRACIEGRARAASRGPRDHPRAAAAFAADDTQGVADPRGLHCDTLTARLHVVDALSTALRTLGAVHRALRSRHRRAGLGADGRRAGHAGGGRARARRHRASTWAAAPPAWRCSPKASCCTPRSCRSAACMSPTTSPACCPRRSRMPSG